MSAASSAVDPLSPVCLSCGMCCDGTLHLRAALDADERDRYAGSGFEYVELETRLYFDQPCRQLCGTACSIYAARPKVCRRYRCEIVRDVETGDMSIGDAIGHVETARALCATAETIMPGVGTSRTRGLARAECANQLDHGDGGERAAAAARLLPMIALDEYLARWFRVKKDQAPASEERA